MARKTGTQAGKGKGRKTTKSGGKRTTAARSAPTKAKSTRGRAAGASSPKRQSEFPRPGTGEIAKLANKGAAARQAKAGRRPGSQPLSERRMKEPWTAKDDRQLRDLAEEYTPKKLIGLKMGKEPRVISQKAKELGLKLHP